jgi:hypothetical protein
MTIISNSLTCCGSKFGKRSQTQPRRILASPASSLQQMDGGAEVTSTGERRPPRQAVLSSWSATGTLAAKAVSRSRQWIRTGSRLGAADARRATARLGRGSGVIVASS